MSLEFSQTTKFQVKTLALIDQANAIIGEYQARGFVLTLRQRFYQFVARNLIQNTQSEYKRLGHIIAVARRAGLIDCAAIDDRTRNVQSVASWRDPPEIVKAIADQYREDLWGDQPFRPEVWIEKEGLLGVIEGSCREYRVPCFACRGNNSETEQYWAGKRFAATIGEASKNWAEVEKYLRREARNV